MLKRSLKLKYKTQNLSQRFQHTSAPLGVDKSIENNLKTQTNRLSKTMTKFWDHIDLSKTKNDDFLLTMDLKPVKTSMGNDLIIPANKPILAMLLMNEWRSLTDSKVKAYDLPLTSLISRCIDMEKSFSTLNNKDLTDFEKVTKEEEMITKLGCIRADELHPQLLRYLDTDTLVCLSPYEEFEGELRKEQNLKYLPVIESFEKFLAQHNNGKAVKIRVLDGETDGFRSNQQSQETQNAVLQYLKTLKIWELIILEKCVLSSKSFILGWLLISKHNKSIPIKHSVEDMIRLSNLEIIYQTERWGEVEDTHDVDQRDIIRKINVCSIAAHSL
ncbi:hypothetical protein QEN19_002834 [Hanseniaspora menglaensis]